MHRDPSRGMADAPLRGDPIPAPTAPNRVPSPRLDVYLVGTAAAMQSREEEHGLAKCCVPLPVSHQCAARPSPVQSADDATPPPRRPGLRSGRCFFFSFFCPPSCFGSWRRGRRGRKSGAPTELRPVVSRLYRGLGGLGMD